MTKGEEASQAQALARLAGSLLVTSGFMIVLLSGGCTLKILLQPGGWAALPFAVIFGGAPMALGAWIGFVGYRRASKRPAASLSANPHVTRRSKGLAWGLVTVGLALTVFAGYEMFWDFWVLVHVFNNALPPGDGGLAFVAAMAHPFLFALAAGAVELGRRRLQRR